MSDFCSMNEVLDKCCQLALRESLLDEQLFLITDASLHAAGYAVLPEDDRNQKFTSKCKTYAPVAYGSKTFTPSPINMSNYAKELLAIYLAYKEF